MLSFQAVCMMTSSTDFALLALCEGNPPVNRRLHSQGQVALSFDVFFDMCLNKRLSKQSSHQWFETPSSSLWRHCIGTTNQDWISVDERLRTVLHHRKSPYTLPFRLYHIILFIEYFNKTKGKTQHLEMMFEKQLSDLHADRTYHFNNYGSEQSRLSDFKHTYLLTNYRTYHFNNYGSEQSRISDFKHTYLLTNYHPLDPENGYADQAWYKGYLITNDRDTT